MSKQKSKSKTSDSKTLKIGKNHSIGDKIENESPLLPKFENPPKLPPVKKGSSKD